MHKNLKKSSILPIEGFIKRRRDLVVQTSYLPPVSMRGSRMVMALNNTTDYSQT